jgi:hypothetical protein
VALEEGERLRGVVHGDAADGPHRGQVPEAARVRQDGLGVVQEREGGAEVVTRAVMMRGDRRVMEAAADDSCRRRGGDGHGRRRR